MKGLGSICAYVPQTRRGGLPKNTSHNRRRAQGNTAEKVWAMLMLLICQKSIGVPTFKTKILGVIKLGGKKKRARLSNSRGESRRGRGLTLRRKHNRGSVSNWR